MGVYVILPCLLEKITAKIYLTEILFQFPQQNSLKVGIDSQNKIVEKYSEIAQNNPAIASWLQIMSYEPTSFERIDIPGDYDDFNQVDLYLKVCKHVAQQKKAIVFSHQTLSMFKYINNEIYYEDCNIIIYDKDEAIKELKPYNEHITINKSIIATGGSSLNKVKLENE